VGKSIANRGMKEFGRTLWKRHEETVLGFWDAIAEYFDPLEVSGFKIYQDGMVADGEMGLTIVREAVKGGSRNYLIISELIRKGAVLVKTEDLNLVREERDWILRMTQGNNTASKLDAASKYRLAKGKLLERRDRFIANRIADTLHENEDGVLFIGAFHNVGRWLKKDIHVEELKEKDKVKEYQKILPFYREN
jgi:pheromone shutdown protein TraB